MPEPTIDRLRAICLALPEVVEKEAWGDPTFRVRDKIFGYGMGIIIGALGVLGCLRFHDVM